MMNNRKNDEPPTNHPRPGLFDLAYFNEDGARPRAAFKAVGDAARAVTWVLESNGEDMRTCRKLAKGMYALAAAMIERGTAQDERKVEEAPVALGQTLLLCAREAKERGELDFDPEAVEWYVVALMLLQGLKCKRRGQDELFLLWPEGVQFYALLASETPRK